MYTNLYKKIIEKTYNFKLIYCDAMACDKNNCFYNNLPSYFTL